MYLAEPRVDFHSDLDVLEYWHSASMRYPELSIMARDLLSIPVRSVALESAFSIGGKTISHNRSSLKPKTVQALICVQDWRRHDDEFHLDIGIDYSFNKTNKEVEDAEDNDEDDDISLESL
ncbi:unnamed protein product [Amaranthus hypochondriacus]